MPAPSASERTSSGQSGSVLVEVMVSAVILLGAIVFLYQALDAQTEASADGRASSTAAALAEADQERLRSFRVPQLSNRNETRTVTVAGVDYTVVSRADWIRDATGGTQGCANATTQADYLRLTSTVTAPTAGLTAPAPVRVRSLVAPPVGQFGEDQGTVAVNTVGARGQAIQGATTTISGPATFSDTSNDLGCAVFGYVPAGSYDVTVSAAGFVDPAGNATATTDATATEGTVNVAPQLQYDRAGSVDVAFDTEIDAGAAVASTAAALSAANAGVPSTGFRLFRPATPQGTITAASLYPFTTPYALYSGSCTRANPAFYDATYFASNPGSVVVDPGGTASVTVREPALRLRVRTVAAATPVLVRVRSVDASCPDVFTWNLTTSGGVVTLPDPGVPFGRYSLCASAQGTQKSIAGPVLLTTRAGSTQQEIDLRSGTTAGACA